MMSGRTLYDTLQQMIDVQKTLRERELKHYLAQKQAILKKSNHHAQQAVAARRQAVEDPSIASLQERTADAHIHAAEHFKLKAGEFDPHIHRLGDEVREILKKEIGLKALVTRDRQRRERLAEERDQDRLSELQTLKNMARNARVKT